jgi:hypothetical protein
MASTQRRPDGTWRVRYRAPPGLERSKHFDRKGDAERFRATVQADLLRGTYLDPDAGLRLSAGSPSTTSAATSDCGATTSTPL